MTKIPILMRILNSVYEHVCSQRKIRILWNLLQHIPALLKIIIESGMPLLYVKHFGSTKITVASIFIASIAPGFID
jgi:hypothetical protein